MEFEESYMKREMPEKKSAKKKNRFFTYLIVLIVLMVVLAGIIGCMIYRQWKQNQSENNFEEIRSEVITEVTVELESEPETGTEEALLTVTVPQLDLDWDNIMTQNEDIYAWIYLPNTNVDYPILQHPTDDSYYIYHNLDGSSGYPGCIYTEMSNSKDFSDALTLVYGHNMKNGTMFRTLHYYEEEDFFEENPYIYIYMPDGNVLVYEIFSAGEFSNVHIINKYGANDRSGLKDYLDDLESYRVMSTHVRSDLTVSYKTDRVLVLCTCMGNEAKRYLVQGVLIYEGAAE